MVFLLLFVFSLLFVGLGKYYFKVLVNPISIYVVIWFFMLSIYHLKYLNYIDLSFHAWILILFTFLSFVLGIVTVFQARKSFYLIDEKELDKNVKPWLFADDGKTIRDFAIIFGLIGLAGAIQHWYVLISMYGSIADILLHLGTIYQLRVSGEMDGIIPYLSSASYISIFFVGLYSGKNGKLSFITILPIVAVVLKGLASVGRASILFGIVELGITILFTTYFFKKPRGKESYKSKKIVLSFIIVICVFIYSVIIIKNLRGHDETFVGETRAISTMKEDIFITPSIYQYLSGHVGVLSKYLESDGEDTGVGENTLLFIYNTLNKFGIVDKPNGYQKGYNIPSWINTGTFIRELHADFGTGGLLLFVYFLGMLISTFWIKVYINDKIAYILPLTYFTLIIVFSFLMMITRLGVWVISFSSLLFLLPIVKKIIMLRIEK